MEAHAVRNDAVEHPKFMYLIERVGAVNQREALLDWLTCRSRNIIEMDSSLEGCDIITLTGTPAEMENFVPLYAVDVKFSPGAQTTEFHKADDLGEDLPVYGVLMAPENDKTVVLIKISDSNRKVAFNTSDKFHIQAGMIANYSGKEPLLTDVGKFLMNQLLLVYPFGDIVPYMNERFDPGKLDDMVAKLIMDGKVTRDMYNTYLENGYWYCEDGSLSTAAWSEKSLTTDPQVAIRKKQLFEENKDHLDDPIVLAKIEKELIDMDKKWLEGDAAAPFYAVEGGKAWKEQRKKMFIMVGMSVAFDKDASKITFQPNSLEEGWEVNHVDTMANDIRRGSYGRGIETAKGGVQTKFVLRIFQDVTVDQDDCGTKRGITVTITDTNYKEYISRYLTDGSLITADNVKNLIGKTVKIRSPMYCESKPGFCYKCCGDTFRKLDVKAIGMQAIAVTGNMTSLSMKSMHTSSLSAKKITDLSRFFR